MPGKEIEGGHEDEMYLPLGAAPSARSVARARSSSPGKQLLRCTHGFLLTLTVHSENDILAFGH